MVNGQNIYITQIFIRLQLLTRAYGHFRIYFVIPARFTRLIAYQ